MDNEDQFTLNKMCLEYAMSLCATIAQAGKSEVPNVIFMSAEIKRFLLSDIVNVEDDLTNVVRIDNMNGKHV